MGCGILRYAYFYPLTVGVRGGGPINFPLSQKCGQVFPPLCEGVQGREVLSILGRGESGSSHTVTKVCPHITSIGLLHLGGVYLYGGTPPVGGYIFGGVI